VPLQSKPDFRGLLVGAMMGSEAVDKVICRFPMAFLGKLLVGASIVTLSIVMNCGPHGEAPSRSHLRLI
jgi:hypothetical protein